VGSSPTPDIEAPTFVRLPNRIYFRWSAFRFICIIHTESVFYRDFSFCYPNIYYIFGTHFSTRSFTAVLFCTSWKGLQGPPTVTYSGAVLRGLAFRARSAGKYAAYVERKGVGICFSFSSLSHPTSAQHVPPISPPTGPVLLLYRPSDWLSVFATEIETVPLKTL